MSRTKEVLYWCENAQGHIFLTHPEAPVPQGFQRFSTTTPSEMDRVYVKMDNQAREEHGQLTESLYNQRKDRIAQWRSDLNAQLAHAETAFEKAFIRAALRANERREEKLNRNTVYGVSAMQTGAAPIPTENPYISVEDIREMKNASASAKDGFVDLRSVKPATEAIQ